MANTIVTQADIEHAADLTRSYAAGYRAGLKAAAKACYELEADEASAGVCCTAIENILALPIAPPGGEG